LWYRPEDYKTLFLLAVIPGLAAVGMSLLLRERKRLPAAKAGAVRFFRFLGYWKDSPPMYRKVVAGLLVFSLFNSSDIFLLLRLKEAGLDDRMVIGAFMFYNLVYAVFAFPLGVLADRIGLRRMFILGLGMFALVYAGMAKADSLAMFVILFMGYGIYSAATEGISKAWISNITRKADTATAIGFYAGFQSISLLLASTLTGLVWQVWGSGAAFLLTASVALGVGVYFFFLREGDKHAHLMAEAPADEA
jgi:MFS family permease